MAAYIETNIRCSFCGYELDTDEMFEIEDVFEYQDETDQAVDCPSCKETFFLNKSVYIDYETSKTNEFGETHKEWLKENNE